MNRKRRIPFAVIIAIAVLLALAVAVHAATSLGLASWTLYLLAVGASLSQSDSRAPLVTAGIASVLAAGAYFVLPQADVGTAIANQLFGLAAIWAAAGAVHHVIRMRNRAADLLWLHESRTALLRALLGEVGPEEIGRNAARVLADALGADAGVLYRLDGATEGATLVPCGGYAVEAARMPASIAVGDGIAGQAAVDGKIRFLEGVSTGQLQIRSALGESTAGRIVVAPVGVDNRTTGIVELAWLAAPPDRELAGALLEAVSEMIGIALRSAEYRERLVGLLEETQRQSEELQVQQEELRVTNEELEEHGRVLQDSKAQLQAQQAELEASNARLAEQARMLEIHERDLLEAHGTLAATAASLEASNRYKSEFLASMSHELRTPLNSALILSKLLAENAEGTLTPAQVRYAKAIHASNSDLLALINKVLDLAKIEAGRVEIEIGPVEVPVMLERLHATIEPMAAQKGLDLRIEADADVPEQIDTDSLRLAQVLKNLMANAVKFTERGSVCLHLRMLDDERLAFEVRDTGVGIPREQFELIFEAFRQGAGEAGRPGAGTGLGLSISRQLARRLGGDISLESDPGHGSVFTLVLPLRAPVDAAQAPDAQPVVAPGAASPSSMPAPMGELLPDVFAGPAAADLRDAVRQRARFVLCVEDDPRVARRLVELARGHGFDCVVASSAGEAMRLAARQQPDAGVFDHALRDAAAPGMRERLQREVRRILIVDAGGALRGSLEMPMSAAPLEVVSVHCVDDALREIESSSFDCVVVDSTLTEGTARALLERIPDRGDTASPQFVVGTAGAPGRREGAPRSRQRDSVLDGRKILLAQKDVRNIFAMSSVFEPLGAQLVIARSGQEALERLDAIPHIDLVLMDLATPGMDGFAAIRRIREQPKWERLPVIALTARATHEHRDHCLEAGASDYVSGPVDLEKLVSLCRVWIRK